MHISAIDETVLIDTLLQTLTGIPNPDKEVMPGIKWGHYGQLYTPAYWKIQYEMYHNDQEFIIDYKLGSNILEEVVACLLGGHGLKSEIGLAAFERLRVRNQIKLNVDYTEINTSLKEAFCLNGTNIHYRFPNQKSKFIAEFLHRKDLNNIPTDTDYELRNWLLSIKGIGLKTASWITRNFLRSEQVAIIDVHIYRAGLIMGLFNKEQTINKNYFELERKFITLCDKLNVLPSKLDALIWLQMKQSNRIAINLIGNP